MKKKEGNINYSNLPNNWQAQAQAHLLYRSKMCEKARLNLVYRTISL